MFDAHPTSHDTIEDFMTELARVSGRPLVRNILLAWVLTLPACMLLSAARLAKPSA